MLPGFFGNNEARPHAFPAEDCIAHLMNAAAEGGAAADELP
jgi:hypothetical protein